MQNRGWNRTVSCGRLFPVQWLRSMTPQRLLLFVLTALAGVGAIYFWAIHLAAAAAAFLVVVLVLVVGALFLRRRRP